MQDLLAIGGPGHHGLPAKALRAARADAVAHLVNELGHALELRHACRFTILLLCLLQSAAAGVWLRTSLEEPLLLASTSLPRQHATIYSSHSALQAPSQHLRQVGQPDRAICSTIDLNKQQQNFEHSSISHLTPIASWC